MSKSSNAQHESAVITYSSEESLKARSELYERMKAYVATPDETERSMGLFLRASLMARIFAIREMYEKVVDLPGLIVDLGTWRGQTAVICENLRAIFEPMHFTRRIVCFDTFEGYQGFSERDKSSDLHKDGTYQVGKGYGDYLSELLVIHEKNNAMGHNHGKHKVITGDCRKTLPAFFNDNPHEIVALAFFDVNAFDPSWESFEHIYTRLVPGGVVAFWQLTRDVIPAEGRVYAGKILSNPERFPHQLHRSTFYPGLCYLTKTSR